MPIKLRGLRAQARALARAGELRAALACTDHMLAANPLDYEARLRIGDLLDALGDAAGATSVYRALGLHNVAAGHPLPALVACKRLQALRESAAEIVGALASRYALGSPALARFAARQAPVDGDAELESPELSDLPPSDELIARARERALDFSVYVQHPEQYLPMPLFSELPADELPQLIDAIEHKRVADGETVFSPGDPGTSFYFVAGGELRVLAADGSGREVEQTRLHENAVFGVMALLSGQPRAASVQVVEEADLLELRQERLAALVTAVPSLAPALDRFARERLLRNLMATSPLFRPFDQQQRMDLLRRFEGHDVSAGTEIIAEGQPGQGLFVVLSGQVHVSTRPAPDQPAVALAQLGAGEVFGEMSLISNRPTVASVRAAQPSTILFLPREVFQRLTAALPALREHFEALAGRRDSENTLRLATGVAAGPRRTLLV